MNDTVNSETKSILFIFTMISFNLPFCKIIFQGIAIFTMVSLYLNTHLL